MGTRCEPIKDRLGKGRLGRVGLLGVGLGRVELAVAGPGWMDTAGPGRMIGLGRRWTESNCWTVRTAGLGRRDRPWSLRAFPVRSKKETDPINVGMGTEGERRAEGARRWANRPS
ncbi:hypothetical protein CRG98_032618 [Punica granatum]|uniref:Uncharacterized protein n=1 Tax=Punica granatum TaxID=22663 RepID=A0A2I0ITD7_PUNGR|nr:hypothetical protein CRG98_032618 [Punica granatum]